MEKKISAVDELHMTRAIEKAASLAAADDTKDRNQLLADCLLKNDVDSRFAKTAAMAFNKRLTVLKFQQTPDEKRPDTFALSDPDTVFAKMGGVEQQEKTASAKTDYGEFGIRMAQPQLQKTASEKKPYVKPLYEERTTMEQFRTHVYSMLQKQAAALPHMRHAVEDARVRLDMAKQAAADALNNLSDFEYSLINAAYGQPLENVLKGRLKERMFRKQARLAKPANALTRQLDKLLEDETEYVFKHNQLVEHEQGLCELCKSATDLGNDMARYLEPGMRKLAGMTSANIGMITRAIPATGLTVIQGMEAIRRATNDALAAGFSNASAMRNSVLNSAAPGEVLDADFLVKDRFRDRLLGWSDMSADPLFSMYPSEQVFNATQKAMDIDPALERPDKREMLRSTVGKLLAQNNRLSEADIAAAATTLKSLQGADKGPAQEAAESVLLRDDKKAPEAPATTSIFEMLNKPTLSGISKDYFQLASNENQKEYAQARKDEEDEAEKNKNKGSARLEAAQKAFVPFMDQMNIRTRVDANGHVSYWIDRPERDPNDPTRTILTPHEVQFSSIVEAFNAYQEQLKAQIEALNA